MMKPLNRWFIAAVSVLASASSSLATSPIQSPPTEFDAAYTRICESVDREYLRGDKLSCPPLQGLSSVAEVSAALAEVFATAGDEQLRVLSEAESQEWQKRVRSSYIGFGISFEPVDVALAASFRLTKVDPDSTAYAAGLRDGDRIANIDGHWDVGLTLAEAAEKLKGEPLSRVEVTVIRDDFVPFQVERDLDGRIGVEVTLDNPRRLYKVRTIFPGSPAEQAGLKQGDLVWAVGSHTTNGLSESELYEYLRSMPLGRNVEFSILRDKNTPMRIIATADYLRDWSRTVSASAQSGGGQHDYAHFRFKNLDWEGAKTVLEDFSDLIDTQPNLVLDLRGATGSDPHIAAAVMARFVDAGVVLRYRTGADVDARYVEYSVEKAELRRTTWGITKKQQAFEVSEDKYRGKVIVLVDNKTSGTAEALANAFQELQRGIVVGADTAGRSEIVARKAEDVVGDSLLIAVPNARLVSAAGDTLGSVKVERVVATSGDERTVVQDALARVNGADNSETIIALIVPLFALLVGLVALFVRLNFSRKQREIDAAMEPTTRDAAEASPPKEAPAPQPEPVAAEAPHRPWWRFFAVLAMPFVILGGLALAGHLFTSAVTGAPKGYYNEITVVAYVDGSAVSQRQTEIVHELSREYSGAIVFRTVDIRHSDERPDWGNFHDADAPVVVVSKIGYNAKGEVVDRHSSMRAAMPKRDIVRYIEMHAKSLNPGWPDVPVTRTRPTTP